LPDTSATCSSYTLPALSSGYGYACKPLADYQKTNGDGWVPINFSISSENKYFTSLPIDPVNDENFYYSYFPGGSFELIARLTEASDKSLNDSGV
jgi:hypothetical protein